ncbi:MAG TPA: DUF3500 domain-containing protein [Bryobacteraceae bacterium]|jgi:hypothetical protein
MRLGLVCLALVFPLAISPQQGSVTPRVVEAANSFLATLSAPEKARVTFGFTSSQRTGWSNLPSGIFQRNGLRFGDLTQHQRDAALHLVATALSRDGYKKVTDIMNGDEVLKKTGGGQTGGRQDGGRGGGVRFGLDEYYIALLGDPSTTAPWMIQFGGHHLAINVTVVGAANVMTPSLPAAQPAKYTLNGQTIRPLGHENDKGFALINALNAAQLKHAVLNYEVNDLVLGPGADGKVIQPEGIPASELDAAQQAMLLDIVHEWVGILNDEAAGAKMAEIKANLPRTWFAWSGATKNGGLAYYRIQGPTVIIEYAPQQGDLDHIHTIYRDPTNDYGAKLIRQ